MKVRAHVVFEGRVQGVFFRANAQRFAESHGLTGWVRNREDGSVEAVFEGEEADVLRAVERCSTEQPYALVRSKRVVMSEFKGEFKDFDVVH